MRLEHLNLVVRDITQSLQFYQAALPNWHVRGGENNSEYFGARSRWVHFGDDFNYLTFNQLLDMPNRAEISENKHNLGLSHLAFEVTKIDDLIKNLSNAGFEPKSNGNPTSFRRNIYYTDPNGLEVEFVEYLSNKPELRNEYV